jgi:hypothetical protein
MILIKTRIKTLNKKRNYLNNENNRIQNKDQKKKRDLKFKRIKEVLKGNHEELIAKHGRQTQIARVAGEKGTTY